MQYASLLAEARLSVNDNFHTLVISYTPLLHGAHKNAYLISIYPILLNYATELLLDKLFFP